MSDGWWDYASFDPVHRDLFVSRDNGVFKLDVDSGLMDQRFIPGSEGGAGIRERARIRLCRRDRCG